jgi:hypothetical protein
VIGYVFDAGLQQRLNADRRNYWDVYLQEIFNQLGVAAQPLTAAQLDEPAFLSKLRVLVVGAQSSALLTAATGRALDDWVRAGGLLIGFGAQGLETTFGFTREAPLQQPGDDYTIAAYFQFWPHPLTREIHPFLYIDQKLFVLSDVVQVLNGAAIELARLYDTAGRDLRRPAIIWRAHGRGFAAYFAFDVAKTIWLLHQGKPLPPVPEGEFARRTPDLQVLGSNSNRIAYADELVHLLQNMIAETGQPFIYPIPPDGSAVPDALLYYSGDEYTGPAELSLQASDFMAQQGLPYHINIATEYHPLTVEQLRRIQANGHEVSCYMWIHTADRQGSILNQERIQAQSDLLLKRFGFRPGAVLIGSTQWCGWAEPARWLAAAGVAADNTFFCGKPTPEKMNPDLAVDLLLKR